MSPVEHASAQAPTGPTKDSQIDTKDEPPAYSVHPQGTHLPTSTSAAVNPLTKLPLKATNFLYINGNYPSAKGTFIIDPLLPIQEAYSPPPNFMDIVLGKRMNMYIHTYGDLDLDLWIVGRKDLDVALDPRRTRMHVDSQSGFLNVKVNTIDNIHPFSLELVTQNKPITVLIPRSFHGTIELSSIGQCIVSKKIMKNGAVLGAVNRKKTYFVGDFLPVMSGSGTRLVKRAPDELKVEAGDKDIVVKYVDEVKSVVPKRRFFGRRSWRIM